MRSRFVLVLLFFLVALTAGRTAEEKEMMQKAIRMKTSRQLKEIFDELGIEYKKTAKVDELRKQAYKENAVGRWEELHPEKKYKKPKGTPGGGGIPGMDGFNPSGDPKMDDLLRQMKGDFSGEKDPERRRILEKLAKKGMSFGGGNNMDTEQLKNMEKMLDGLGGGGFGGMGGGAPGGGADAAEPSFSESSSLDDDVADEDKMEL